MIKVYNVRFCIVRFYVHLFIVKLAIKKNNFQNFINKEHFCCLLTYGKCLQSVCSAFIGLIDPIQILFFQYFCSLKRSLYQNAMRNFYFIITRIECDLKKERNCYELFVSFIKSFSTMMNETKISHRSLILWPL